MNKKFMRFVISTTLFIGIGVGIYCFGYTHGKHENTEYIYTEPELNPCPICGHKVSLNPVNRSWHIECEFGLGHDGCGLSTGYYNDKNELITAWNKGTSNEISDIIEGEITDLPFDTHLDYEGIPVLDGTYAVVKFNGKTEKLPTFGDDNRNLCDKTLYCCQGEEKQKVELRYIGSKLYIVNAEQMNE